MRTLIDTNLLVSLVSARGTEAQRILEHFATQGDELVVSPQCIYEFWAVATRPLAANGLGKNVAEAATEVAAILNTFDLLSDPAGLVETWLKLCQTHQVLGKPSHDCRQVAFAVSHNCQRIATLDGQLYARFSEIEIISKLNL